MSVVNLPADAEILETAVEQIQADDKVHEPGSWYAAIRFKVPGQGGYDRANSDDMLRTGFASEEAARSWLQSKLLDRRAS